MKNESSHSPKASRSSGTEPDAVGARRFTLWILSGVFALSLFVSLLGFRLLEPSPLLRAGLVLLPLLTLAVFIRAEVRAVRRLDELQRRIQLEALAFAYPVLILLVLAVVLLHQAGVDWSARKLWKYWALAVVPYLIGLHFARRRYL